MSKQALCMRLDTTGAEMENWDTFLMDRAVVDDPNNRNPVIQQILPYVTFFRVVENEKDGHKQEVLEILSYRRGNAGDEKELVERRSVGFGGHIDSLPGDNLLAHIHDEAAREIREELGLKVNSKKLHAAIVNCARHYSYLVVNDGTVNSVHTGLSLLLNYNDHENGQQIALEKGHIEDVRWIDVVIRREGDERAVLREVDAIGHVADREQIVRLEQRDTVRIRQALAAFDLVGDR